MLWRVDLWELVLEFSDILDFLRNSHSKAEAGAQGPRVRHLPTPGPRQVSWVHQRHLAVRNWSPGRFKSLSLFLFPESVPVWGNNPDQASTMSSAGWSGWRQTGPYAFVCSPELAFPQNTSFPKNSQVYRKGEENNATHIYILFI